MRIRNFIIVIFSFTIGGSLNSYGSVKDYDNILFEVYNLRPNTVRKLLAEKTSQQSFDLYSEFIDNLNEAIEVTLYEDEKRFENYIDNLNERLDRIDEKANKNDPGYHIIMGDIYVYAALAHIANNDFIAGFRKLLKANKNARLNEEKHPEYWYNNKLNGALNVCLDMMPAILKTVSAMFGLKGDAEKGYKQLDQYLKDVNDYPGLKSEALLYYGFSLKTAKDEERAYEIFSNGIDTSKTPALTTFLASNIMFKTARNEEALTYMSFFPFNKIEVPFQHADYLVGKGKLNKLEPDANMYLERFLSNSNSKNYSREISLKLAHYYLINGNKDKYEYYIDKVDEYPKAKTDGDREADVEIERPYPPNLELLKTRYLVHGGYYTRASTLLNNIEEDKLINPAYSNEFNLYKAIIYFHEDSHDKAIEYCKKVIENGSNCDEHFASQAALLAGKICFEEGNFNESNNYLKLAKSIKGQNDVYIEVIHKKANNMLNKLKKGSFTEDV